ncbi:MAG TPA: dihydropteroate synthase [Terriglobales bacterium]|nr:dihydropteroate synthase [Terriglobales bacterium]
MRPRFTWRLCSRTLELGPRTLIMGVLNVTPDSFSDGGRFFEPKAAIEQGLELLDEGADILDIGGESTRPGAVAISGQPAVSAEEELRRVMPVIEELLRRRPQAVVSIDTYKARVARTAVEAGAEIANDVSGLRWDSEMKSTVAGLKCGVVLMHMRGRPAEWRTLPPLDDPVGLIGRELREGAEAAVAAGIARERIVLDPGFGFGKSFDENYPLLAHFDELHQLGFPLLAGVSRKSFIGRTLATNGTDAPPQERLYGSLAAMTAAILRGAHIVRVHDVKAAVQAAKIADAIEKSATD